jgi:hypothetical protein
MGWREILDGGILSKASRQVPFLALPPPNKQSQWITEVTFPLINLMGCEDNVSLPSVAIQRLPGAILHFPYASRSTTPLIANTTMPYFIINSHTSTCPSTQCSPAALTLNYKESTVINARA